MFVLNDIRTILGLLGERYGWIPTAQQKSRAKHLGLYEYFQNILIQYIYWLDENLRPHGIAPILKKNIKSFNMHKT